MPLAEPYEGMTPEEKGELLLRYVAEGQPVGRLAFSEASLVGAELQGADLAQGCLGRADLSGADLSGADLSGADLSGAVMWRAELSGARLGGAILRKAALDRVDLSGADLSRADLVGVDLTQGCLDDADLTGAGLRRARLERCSLRRACLDGADLSDASALGSELRVACSLQALRIDPGTYTASAWSPELLAELVARGARATDLEDTLQRAAPPGLTLYLDTPQGPGAQAALQIFACDTLGWDRDVRLSTIEAHTTKPRLLGAEPLELITLAEALASPAPWAVVGPGQGLLWTLSDRLQHLREALEGQVLVILGIHLRLDRGGWRVIGGAPGGITGSIEPAGIGALLDALR
ncbi:MAG TPA: pentapeptide repeat-containing protein [Deltaproteobacteria bacterium]|nr:pentapeptide repeat-containing protein [Deltaproteobacteria bacterium]